MDKTELWQNFDLCTELHISGGFIYNGLKCLHEIETLHYGEDIFEVFYNLSVGIERLLKVAIVLLEYDNTANQGDFEESLITHNLQDLLTRIKNKRPLNLAAPHNEFLQILSVFYKTHRYYRYNLPTGEYRSKEKVELLSFLNKRLNMHLEEDCPSRIAGNEKRIRRHIGRLVGKISEQIYEVVYDAASLKNLFSYEIRLESKAAKIFLAKEYDFEKEAVLWKEILIFLMNSKNSTRFLNILRNIPPLELDPNLMPDYFHCLGSDVRKTANMDEVSELYADLPSSDRKERYKTLELIDRSSAYIDWDFEDDSK